MKNLISRVWKLKTWVAILLIGVMILGSQPVMAATTQFFSTISATIANITTLNAPTGRTSTYVVAASNSTTIEKAQADYVCTGTADNVIINSTLLLGNVYLTRGTFTESNGGSILIPSNRTLEGNGYNSTLITCANGSSGKPIITNLDTVGGNTNIIIENIKIDGDKAGQSSTGYTCGIELRKVNNATIQDNWIQNAYMPAGGVAANTRGQGVNVLQSSNIIIQNNYTTQCFAGISARNACTAISILNNYSWLNDDEGIAVAIEGGTGQGNNGIVITGNNIWDNSQVGDTMEIVVADDYVNANPQSPTYNVTIANNIIKPKYVGIQVSSMSTSTYQVSQCSITGNVIDNTIYGTYSVGILVLRVKGCEIAGNNVIGAGIKCDAADYSNVSANHVIGLVESIAIYMNALSNGSVVGNTIEYYASTNYPKAVLLNNTCSNTLVSDNQIINTQTAGSANGVGIQVFSGANNYVTNNKFYSNSLTYGSYEAVECGASSSNTVINNNDFRHSVKTGGTIINQTTSTGNVIYNNQGYIAPGEIRTISGTINTLTQNAYNAILNPYAQNVYVTRVEINISTKATGTPNLATISSGIGVSATTDYNNLFTAIPCETVALYDSYVAGDTGAQTKPLLWTTAYYLNMSIKTAAATGMVATYYITVQGQ